MCHLVGLVAPSGDMCPSVIRTPLLRRLTIRANDWTGEDSATFATVCKFDVWRRTKAMHSISQALIRNSKGRASRITLDTWQSEASCYLRTPQGGNSASQQLTKSAKSETNLAVVLYFARGGHDQLLTFHYAARSTFSASVQVRSWWRRRSTLTGSPWARLNLGEEPARGQRDALTDLADDAISRKSFFCRL